MRLHFLPHIFKIFSQSQIFMQLTKTSKSRFLNLNSWLIFICTKDTVYIWPSRGHVSFSCKYSSCFVSCFRVRYGHRTSLSFYCTLIPLFRKKDNWNRNQTNGNKQRKEQFSKRYVHRGRRNYTSKNVVKYVNRIWEEFFFLFSLTQLTVTKLKLTLSSHFKVYFFVVLLFSLKTTFSFHFKILTVFLFQSSHQTYHDKYICIYIYLYILYY